jgi:hypothetical protein
MPDSVISMPAIPGLDDVTEVLLADGWHKVNYRSMLAPPMPGASHSNSRHPGAKVQRVEIAMALSLPPPAVRVGHPPCYFFWTAQHFSPPDLTSTSGCKLLVEWLSNAR